MKQERMVQKTASGPHVVIVDGVRRQADVLDVPPQLRQHLHKKYDLTQLQRSACSKSQQFVPVADPQVFTLRVPCPSAA